VVTVPDADTAARTEVLAWFASHSSANSNTYATFSNPEMLVFLVPGLGVQPYTVARHWGRRLVCAVGDPVCQAEHTGPIQQLFRQSFPAAVFMDLSKGAAQQLVAHDPSLLVNHCCCPQTVQAARQGVHRRHQGVQPRHPLGPPGL
jgi:hypothetical protein